MTNNQRIILGLVMSIMGFTMVAIGLVMQHSRPSHEKLNKSIVERYGENSRLMMGDDEISQSIIDRYCLAESKDYAPDEHYPLEYRPWLCGPMPPTYDIKQNPDGTYHLRYKPENLNNNGEPIDIWNHKGVKNIEFPEFMEGLEKMRRADSI